MTEQEFATKKRSLQVRIGQGRAQVRRIVGDAQRKLKAMQDVQKLERALSQLHVEFEMADGA